MFKPLSVFVLIASVIVATNCGGKKAQERAVQKAIEDSIKKQSGGKAKVDLSKGQITIKDKQGEMTMTQGGGAQLPDGFPNDVPVYPGAAITMSAKQPKAFMVMLTSKDDKKKVADTYKSTLKAQGWEEGSSMDMGDVTSLEYKKEKEKRTLVIGISKDNAGSRITLNVEKQAE
jgi:hypothetical protein